MSSLLDAFLKIPFTVQKIVVCPLENSRGRLTGYNMVAQGAQNQQSILESYGVDTDFQNLKQLAQNIERGLTR